jgi:hypothetical protein
MPRTSDNTNSGLVRALWLAAVRNSIVDLTEVQAGGIATVKVKIAGETNFFSFSRYGLTTHSTGAGKQLWSDSVIERAPCTLRLG